MTSKKSWSNYQEKQIASALNWSVVTGSGSRHLYPGDVIAEEWLGECKTHVYDNYTIQFNYNVWNKIVNEAKSRFKHPVLFVDDGSHTLNHTWAMFSTSIQLPENCIISEYPYKIRKNVVFSGSELSSRLVINAIHDKKVVYKVNNWNSQSVYVCEFRYFAEMFGDN